MATENEPVLPPTDTGLAQSKSIDPDFLRAEGPPRANGPDRGFGVFLTSALLGLVMGGVGAWAYVNFIHPELARQRVDAVQPAADAARAEENPLTERVEDLSGRVEQLQSRIEQVSKASPLPDLEPINQKLSMVDDLSRKVEAEHNRVVALPEKIDQNARKISTMMAELEGVRTQLATLRDEVQPAKSTAEPARAESEPASQPTAAEPSASKSTENDYERGVEQFQKQQYKEASETFSRLTSTKPDDARVFYYAALARGFSAGDWKGETERLVKQGVALERDGKPDKALIDAAFNGLTAATGKEWLSYYRRSATSTGDRSAK